MQNFFLHVDAMWDDASSWFLLQRFITSQSFYRMYVSFIIPILHRNFSSLMDFQQCGDWSMCFYVNLI